MTRTPAERASSKDVRAVSDAQPRSPESQLAAEIKALAVGGEREAARDRFGELVARQQRRAVGIAYHYLRDAQDTDEAVQDAFLKVFTHIGRYREELPFEVWFTRILVNTCMDVRKARARRTRWSLPLAWMHDATPIEPVAPDATPEQQLVTSERLREIRSAVETLPARQRTVFTLCHVAGQTAAEVSATLGVSEATVRVHLFRAVRRLRRLLENQR
jgi:RNA polymerase sigma-70 factor (ECF subfamily)